MRRKRRQARRVFEELNEKVEQTTGDNGDNKEKEQGSAIEVIPDKATEAVKKGLVITNIKF